MLPEALRTGAAYYSGVRSFGKVKSKDFLIYSSVTPVVSRHSMLCTFLYFFSCYCNGEVRCDTLPEGI